MKALRKSFAKFTGKIFHSRYALVFINGFLLASLLYFYTEDSYERTLFETLAGYVKDKSAGAKNSEEALLLNSLHLTYSLGENRAAIFRNREFHSIKSSIIHPVTYDLMTNNGACGSYAYILSRLLNELKIPNRIAQMQVEGNYGGHILVEAKTSKGWVVMDGSYDLYFKRADGRMASFNDVQNNWNFYRTQTPANYDSRYSYAGVRYTNWDKVPVVMPMIRNILSLAMGREMANSFSFRTYMLRKFHILFEVTICIYWLLLLVVIRNYVRNNREKIKIYFSSFVSRKRPLLVLTAEAKRKVA
ncbi:hypothetical protein FAM09_05160 [Niastella caeni]|uniref:Transglutaminase domain-containing protein n=1 Tax=Niastella caeni TaxID=2569763 RepID=A0A4S8I058_9BACT|nr:hypothetical protein [Niastella caeni]THU41498.1 hypothetical protein FAM09_05160 [Niastella caeni]